MNARSLQRKLRRKMNPVVVCTLSGEVPTNPPPPPEGWSENNWTPGWIRHPPEYSHFQSVTLLEEDLWVLREKAQEEDDWVTTQEPPPDLKREVEALIAQKAHESFYLRGLMPKDPWGAIGALEKPENPLQRYRLRVSWVLKSRSDLRSFSSFLRRTHKSFCEGLSKVRVNLY